jgi:transcriptional regulator with XRE-family HTH domain
MGIEIAMRLREARTALGMTVEEFGAAGGVTKQAQINYEKGVRHPDTQYLTALAQSGVDVAYILLGDRKLQVQVGADELPVLDAYRHGRPELQEAARKLLLNENPALQKALVTVINATKR